MTDSVLVTALLLAHILAAIGWLGGAFTVAIALGPLLPKFSPSTRVELIQQFFPRFTKMMEAFAGLTIVFGLGLLGVMAQGGSFSWSDPWSQRIVIGMALAFVAFLLGLVVIVPATMRASRLFPIGAPPPAGPPPAELPRLLRRIQIGSPTVVVILVVTVGFMVAAAGV